MAISRDSIRPGLIWRPGSAVAPRLGIGRAPRFLAGAVAVASLTGCSIDEHGLVRVRHYETPTATMLTLDGFGGHLSTFDVDRGFTLGWAETTYVFPKGTPIPESGLSEHLKESLLNSSTRVMPVEDHRVAPRPTDPPFVVVSRRAGFAIDANARRAGLFLGWQERAAILVGQEAEVVVFVRLDPAKPEETEIFINGKTQ